MDEEVVGVGVEEGEVVEEDLEVFLEAALAPEVHHAQEVKVDGSQEVE